MEIGWKGRRCKSLPIYGKQCIFPSEMVSFPQNNACPKLNSHKYHAVFREAVTLSNPPSQMGKHKKICILGPPHLSLEAAFSSNWTEVIKCGSRIDSAYQQKAHLNGMIDTNPTKTLFSLFPQQINLFSLLMSEIWGEKIAKTRKRETRNQEANTVYYWAKHYLAFCCTPEAELGKTWQISPLENPPLS